MINTYNESSLHKTLKSFYSLKNEGSKTEVPQGPFIVDIKCKDESIIEIQTANLSKLKEKCLYFLKQNTKVTIVFPLAVSKTICTKNPETGRISKRKSPVHKSVYSIFRELTGLYQILLNKNFYLEILPSQIIEVREKTQIPVQSKNNMRRHKRDWLKTDKILESLEKEIVLHGKSSYKKLIPVKKGQTFTASALLLEIKNTNPHTTMQEIRFLLWVYKKLNLIKEEGKIGNSKLYVLM